MPVHVLRALEWFLMLFHLAEASTGVISFSSIAGYRIIPRDGSTDQSEVLYDVQAYNCAKVKQSYLKRDITA